MCLQIWFTLLPFIQLYRLGSSKSERRISAASMTNAKAFKIIIHSNISNVMEVKANVEMSRCLLTKSCEKANLEYSINSHYAYKTVNNENYITTN